MGSLWRRRGINDKSNLSVDNYDGVLCFNRNRDCVIEQYRAWCRYNDVHVSNWVGCPVLLRLGDSTGETMRKSRKVKRVVLGEGYIAGWREEPVSLRLIQDPALQPLHNLSCPVSRWSKIRLIAEILE